MPKHFNNFTTKIETGDHICFLNETESELRTVLSDQLSQGLERDEKLLYISHANNLETIQILLKDIDVNGYDYLQSGQLEIINWVDFYFSEGGFDLNKLLDRLRQETNQAIDGGYSALRVISEMTWTNQSTDDIDLLREYETSIDEFTNSNPCIFTCLYDMGKFESEVLMDVLRRHPKVALAKEIYENNYYIPPEKFKHADPKVQELKGWLYNIIEHKRIKEQLYEGLFDRVPIGLYISTPEGKYIDANNSFLKIHGFPDLKTLLASKIEDRYVNPEDRFRWMASIAEQSPLKGTELQVRKYDGTPIWVRMNAEAVKDNNDQVIFYEISEEDITYLKQVQELLQINEERFRNLFETMSEGVVYILPDGQISLANPAAERILGLERDEIEGRNYVSPDWDILRSDGTPMQPDEMAGPRAIKEMHQVKNVVMGMVRPDSSISWINVNATPLIDKSGNITGAVGTFSDVTEQVLAQESLRKSEKQLQDVFETMSEGIVFINPNGQITFSNAAAQRILELEGIELKNINISSPQREIFLGDGTPIQTEDFAGPLAMNGLRPVNDIVIGVKRQDGSLFWINSNAAPMINNEGKLEGVVATFTDITEKKLADEELKKTKDHLILAQQIANFGSWEIILRDHTAFWSDEIYRQFGLKPNELIPSYQAFEQFVHPGEKEKADKCIRQAVIEGKPFSVDTRIIQKNGSERVIHAQGKVHEDDFGNPVKYIGVQQDITERKKAEEELKLSLEQIKHSQKSLLGLSRAGEAVQRTRSSYQQVYEVIGDELAKFGFHTTISTLSEGRKYLELQYYNFPDPIANTAIKSTGISHLGFGFPLKPEGYHKRLLDAGEVVLTDLGTDPIHEIFLEHLQPLSKKLAPITGLEQIIYAPLTVNDQSFGILSVIGHGLSNDDIPALKTFAAHASIAIENTMLFDAERAAHQQMVDLTNYLQVVREEERTYMAREIHDEFGQRLTALKMDISWLTNHLPTVDTAIIEKVSAMDKLVDESIQLVRHVAADLRPGLLDDLGLTAALEWQTQDFTKRSGIEFDLYLGDTDMPPVQDRDTVLFRVFQEALTNIARHSRATKITVDLTAEDDFVLLKIHDNGIGITSEALNGTESLGLLGMRERARSLGGDVEITGIPDQGTTVFVNIPK
jgi:PAS domain S-box-containing protein